MHRTIAIHPYQRRWWQQSLKFEPSAFAKKPGTVSYSRDIHTAHGGRGRGVQLQPRVHTQAGAGEQLRSKHKLQLRNCVLCRQSERQGRQEQHRACIKSYLQQEVDIRTRILDLVAAEWPSSPVAVLGGRKRSVKRSSAQRTFRRVDSPGKHL